jgi:phenylpyruvate tautomerase PptA (4-oxalocrotonate tautomerase family)
MTGSAWRRSHSAGASTTSPISTRRFGRGSNFLPVVCAGFAQISKMSRSAAMPFVRIDLQRGKSAEYRKALGEIVYQAMRDVINVPENDKFQVITEHAPDELNISTGYLGQRYSDDIILIQITLSIGRSVELKKAFYKRIVDDMHTQLQVRADDVVINLVEVAKENWSFGGGIAQYVT